jgi:hypothetical protein
VKPDLEEQGRVGQCCSSREEVSEPQGVHCMKKRSIPCMYGIQELQSSATAKMTCMVFPYQVLDDEREWDHVHCQHQGR